MNAIPDHSGSPAGGESGMDRWNALWEPAARRYQPLVDPATPAGDPAAMASPETAAQP
ncbi:hypothetical protein ACLRGI_06900 [Paenarthrobacter nitroguajacolicus]|uniref:hypothetical protein n=1 Tax=Paenarthrobacter nitroguajacolicus TaxID=211146 RepID=UPI003AED30E4